MRSWTRNVAALVVMVMTVASCGGDGEDAVDAPTTDVPSPSVDDAGAKSGTASTSEAVVTDSTPDSSDAPDRGTSECPAEGGGTITWGMRAEPQGLDPLVSGTVGSTAGSERFAVLDAIMGYDAESGRYAPRMAETLEANDDFTQFTLRLRDDVTFGNGEPVTTEAVAFTIERHRADDSISQERSTAQLIEEMEIVDDRTMVFHLTGPFGNFASVLAGPLGMPLHPATFEELGADEFAADPQGGGAGAFRLERWAPGEEMVLVAKDDWWGGDVCLDRLRIVYGLTDDAKVDSLALGELDATLVREPEEAARARSEGYARSTYFTNGGYLLQINHGQDHPGADPRIREAISYAVDPQLVNERGFGGVGNPDNRLVSESSPLYSPGVEGQQYDPERARELLEEAMADGYDGELYFLCNKTYGEAAIAITGLLERVGFDVEVESSLAIEDWVAQYLESDFDITCGSAAISDSQPWATMQRHYSGVGENSTVVHYDSPAMVEALTALKEAGTVDDRRTAWAEVQRVWNEDTPARVYGHAVEETFWRDGVGGIGFTVRGIAHFEGAYNTN